MERLEKLMKDNAQAIRKKRIRRQKRHDSVKVEAIWMNEEIRKKIKLRKMQTN